MKQRVKQKSIRWFCISWLLGLLIVCSSCSERNEDFVTLKFSFQPYNNELSETGPSETAFDKLMFYIHNVELIDKTGSLTAMTIVERPPWQGNGVGLLSLAGKQLNPFVKGTLKKRPMAFNGIRFKLGVPEARNHSDPLKASTPLNISSMFWTWQTGYKFFRFDTSHNNHSTAFHMGSTGCQSSSAIRPPTTPCLQANIATIEITEFDPATKTIHLDLKKVVELLGQANGGRCAGSYSDDVYCKHILEEFGLSANTGKCIEDCQLQSIFSSRP